MQLQQSVAAHHNCNVEDINRLPSECLALHLRQLASIQRLQYEGTGTSLREFKLGLLQITDLKFAKIQPGQAR